MGKREKSEWKQRKQFEDDSIDIKPWAGLNVEHQNTAKHEFVKFCLTRILYEKDRSWDSEVRFGNGREADIVSLGSEDEKATVYEVETGVTPGRKKEKLNHFYYPYEQLVRDVIIIDPADVPDDLESALEYLETHHVIG